jgi:arylsulfatase A-like enzyme
MSTFAELAGVTPPETTDGISVVNRLTGKKQAKKHKYLYWDYGHCRDRYDQAVRFENWKGIRLGQHAKIQLYDLNNDMGETNDLAESYPEIVSKIEKIMDEAHVPSERYPVGVKYQGGPIWKKNNNE